MKKAIIVIIITIMSVSCTKVKQSEDFLHGDRLYFKFVDHYLSGEPRLAEFNFYKGISVFRRMDSVCNISRFYIARYVLDEEGPEFSLIENAEDFARLGKCSAESEVARYLAGRDYDIKKLAEPYNLIAIFLKEHDDGKLISYAENEKTQRYSASRIYRFLAKHYLISNPDKAFGLAKKAHEIDKFNGWTLNLYRDLKLMISARKNSGGEYEHLNTRKDILEKTLANFSPASDE